MLINLIIIYFACGSPIGIYSVSRVSNSRSRRLTTVGAYFVFWPIFLPKMLRRSFSDNNVSSEMNIERQIMEIRTKMEKIAFTAGSTVTVFEFREVFSRFTGLTVALKQNSAGNSTHDFLAITNHKNSILASACVDRRHRTRLAFHRRRAQNELVDVISAIAISTPNGDQLINLGMELSRLLNDKETADDLRAQKLDIASFAAGG